MRLLALSIAALQVIDVVLHAATHQLEPIRVAANLLIGLWLLFAADLPFRVAGRRLPVAAGAIGIYVLLNLVFLAQAGLTNPTQGGAPRVALLVLVVLTTGLSIWLAIWQRRAHGSTTN